MGRKKEGEKEERRERGSVWLNVVDALSSLIRDNILTLTFDSASEIQESILQ